MNINLDDNLISLGEALTHFNATLSGEGGGLRLPLREKKFARVRLAILSVVLQLTKERSLADISVREICELAQVAPATFFNYFPSKEDVLVYYMRLWSIPVTLQCRAVATQRTVLDAIITVFDFTAREMEQYPRLMFEIIPTSRMQRNRRTRTHSLVRSGSWHFPTFQVSKMSNHSPLTSCSLRSSSRRYARENCRLPSKPRQWHFS